MTSSPDDERAGDRAYFRLPGADWSAVLPAVQDQLLSIRDALEAVVDPAGPAASAAAPAEFALQLGEVAAAIFEALSPKERTLRQVITTLRTGLALCWDMYGADEASRVSVAAHMRRLQTDIDDFERELLALQVEAGANTNDPDGDEPRAGRANG